MNTLRFTKHTDWFKELSFVSRAINKKNPPWRGESYNFIYIQDGIASATDKYRCHQASVDLKDGVYDVVKCTKTEIILNPLEEGEYAPPVVWECIYPKHENFHALDLQEHFNVPWQDHALVIISKLLPLTQGIQFSYLKDMEEGMTAYIYGEDHHVVAFTDEVLGTMWGVISTFKVDRDFDPPEDGDE
jgi:hypothetical protein